MSNDEVLQHLRSTVDTYVVVITAYPREHREAAIAECRQHEDAIKVGMPPERAATAANYIMSEVLQRLRQVELSGGGDDFPTRN